MKRCVVITGMSGAGKSSALRILEDEGLYACDNLPPPLLPQLIDVLQNEPDAVRSGVAVVIDARGRDMLEDLFASLEAIKDQISKVSVVFLDASDDQLVRRFETTRRRHPLGSSTTILECIAKERELLAKIKEKSDIIKDTSSMLASDLRNALLSELGISDGAFSVIVSSFGFKYGIPMDCDYLFDVRFLPNPNYVPELKMLSGRDEEVRAYLDKIPAMHRFIELADELIDFILTEYSKTGKKQVHIAFGCTGGRHRSVASAEMICDHLARKGHDVSCAHRDIHIEEE